MKIVCCSDFHGQYLAKRLIIPDGDIFIFTGDFTASNSYLELQQFANWMAKLPHNHKVFVAGNHDRVCETNKDLVIETLKAADPRIVYLYNELVEIDGLKIYGTPIQPEFFNWAFNRSEIARQHYYSLIPSNVDILVTHCPPYGILDWCRDGSVGCPILRMELDRILPKYMIFGHIHESRGVKEDTIGNHKVMFVNCSVLDGQYRLVHDPIVIEIV